MKSELPKSISLAVKVLWGTLVCSVLLWFALLAANLLPEQDMAIFLGSLLVYCLIPYLINRGFRLALWLCFCATALLALCTTLSAFDDSERLVYLTSFGFPTVGFSIASYYLTRKDARGLLFKITGLSEQVGWRRFLFIGWDIFKILFSMSLFLSGVVFMVVISQTKVMTLYGLKDEKGQVFIAPKYQFLSTFQPTTGLARMKINDKWGFIDRTGKVAIEPVYQHAFNFEQVSGLATVKINDKYGCIDRTGKMVVQPNYQEIFAFDQTTGLASVQINDKQGYIDRTGKEVCNFEKTTGLARSKINDKWGYINRTGKVVVKPIFQDARDFNSSTGLAHVQINDKLGDIDRTGKMVDKPIDSGDELTKNFGLLKVQINGNWGYANQAGKVVVEPIYQDIEDFDFKTGLATMKINGKWGYINQTGKVVIEPTYQYAMKFNSHTGLAEVKLNGKWGYIDRTGKLVVEPIHQHYYTYSVVRRCLTLAPSRCMATTSKKVDYEYIKERELADWFGRDL